jgi:hypothetical protein
MELDIAVLCTFTNAIRIHFYKCFAALLLCFLTLDKKHTGIFVKDICPQHVLWCSTPEYLIKIFVHNRVYGAAHRNI